MEEDWCVPSAFNPAAGSTCQNGGTCVNSFPPSSGVTCDCPAGFTGRDCSEQVNPCTDVPIYPCKSGGTCVPLNGTDYVCKCPVGYSGQDCSHLDNPCIDIPGGPCEHGGACVLRSPGNATCDCTGTGYFGSYCDQSINYCASNPCQNLGRCINLPALQTYNCSCGATLYYGRNCTELFDICAPGTNPCINGACQLTLSGFTCHCFTGFSGQFCEAYTPSVVAPTPSPKATAAPTAAPLPVTYAAPAQPVAKQLGYARLPGNYEVAMNLSIDYILLFNGYSQLQSTIQSDLRVALNLPSTRCVLLNTSANADGSSQVVVAWLATNSTTQSTPAAFYTAFQLLAKNTHSTLYTNTQLLWRLTGYKLIYPVTSYTLTVATEEEGSASSPVSPVAIGSLAFFTIAYLSVVASGIQWYVRRGLKVQ